MSLHSLSWTYKGMFHAREFSTPCFVCFSVGHVTHRPKTHGGKSVCQTAAHRHKDWRREEFRLDNLMGSETTLPSCVGSLGRAVWYVCVIQGTCDIKCSYNRECSTLFCVCIWQCKCCRALALIQYMSRMRNVIPLRAPEAIGTQMWEGIDLETKYK